MPRAEEKAAMRRYRSSLSGDKQAGAISLDASSARCVRPVKCGGATGQSKGYPLASGTPAQTGSWELRATQAAVRAIRSHSHRAWPPGGLGGSQSG